MVRADAGGSARAFALDSRANTARSAYVTQEDVTTLNRLVRSYYQK